jgi:hypothetical protein
MKTAKERNDSTVYSINKKLSFFEQHCNQVDHLLNMRENNGVFNTTLVYTHSNDFVKPDRYDVIFLPSSQIQSSIIDDTIVWLIGLGYEAVKQTFTSSSGNVYVSVYVNWAL